MKRALGFALAGMLCAAAPASAGLLDKLKEVNKKLEETNQRQRQTNEPSGGGNFGGSLSAGLGATKFEALSEHQKCFAPLKGLRAKITADKIEQKMAAAKPTGAERKAWEEDLASWRAAQNAGADSATSPDPKNPHRGLDRLSQAEQTNINAEFGAQYNEVTSACQGRDHMNAGKKTKMNYIQDNTATEASTAKHADTMASVTECFKAGQGLRMRVTADVLQKKLQAQKNLSAKDRQDWEADIASFRAAADQNLTMPPAVDPKQPMRGMMRLGMDEQMAVNEQYSAVSQAHMAQCSAMAGSGKIEERAAPSNPKAKKQTRKAAVGTGIGGTTNLQYMRRTAGCERPIKGHLAKLTADKLEAKLKAAKGLVPQKRQEWEADITAWRAAEQAGADQATPPDADNPYRWYDYVTNAERAQLNQQHALFAQKIMQECAKQDAGL